VLDLVLTSLITAGELAKRVSPWALFAASLGIAAVVGLLSAQLRKTATRWVSWPASALLSLVAILITTALVVGIGVSVPAADSPSFGDAPKYKVSVRPNSLGSEATPFAIELSFSPEIRVDSDSVLTVSRIDTEPRSLAEARVIAESATELSLRGARSCGAASSPQAPGQNAACALTQSAADTTSAKWIYRTSKPGEYLITLAISGLVVDANFKSPSSRWQASIAKNGEVIEKFVHSRDGRDWHGGEDRTDIKRIEVRLDSTQPRFRDQQFELDLASGQLEVRVTAQTTLGVSASLYQYLSIAATALSAALGGGWIWQFVTYLRNRKKPAPQHVPLSRKSKTSRT
jgi:hypothetical protein